MHLAEKSVGPFRVYAAAVEHSAGGFAAAAAIKKVGGVADPIEVFRDEQLAAPHVWDDADAALRFALKVSVRVAEEWSAALQELVPSL